jgi:hypothetical protein
MNSNPVKKLVLKKETLRNLIGKTNFRGPASIVTQNSGTAPFCC